MDFIFDFNQAKISTLQAEITKTSKDGKESKVVYSVDMNDLLIMQYIVKAICSNTMQHATFDNVSYVWIDRNKLLEDLPILDISTSRLSHIFDKLDSLDLIKRKQCHMPNKRGSKVYFCVTELLISCMDDKCDNYYKLMDYDELDAENSNSDISNSYNNKINNKTIKYIKSKDISELAKITTDRYKKESVSLYQSCINDINDTTENNELREILKEYLDKRLKMKSKSFSKNCWKTILNKLNALANNDKDRIALVKQSIDKNWASFFEIKDDNYSNKNKDVTKRLFNIGVTAEQMTDDDMREIERQAEERRKNGKRVEF